MTGVFAGIAAAAVAAAVALSFKLAVLQRIGAAPFGSDTYFYLAYADQMRRTGHRVPDRIDFLFGGTGRNWAVPSLVPWLFSFTSRGWLDRHHALVPIIAKTLAVFVLAVFTGWLAASTGLDVGHVATAALVSGLLYALSPINWNANRSNLSDFTFGPRAPATLFATAAGLLAVVGAVEQSWTLAVMAVVAVAGSVLTAKFSTQVCAFVLPSTAALTLEPAYLVATLAGFVAAIVLTKGQIGRSLDTQVRHLAFYARKLVHENAPFRSPFETLDVLRIPRLLIQHRWADLRAMLMSNVVFRGLVLYPIHVTLGLVLMADLIFDGGFASGMNPAQSQTSRLWLASLLVFLFTSLPPLRFLGEADRYLDYLGFAPATALFALWLVTSPASVALAVLGTVIAVTIGIASRPRARAPRQVDDAALTAACAWLRERADPKARILTVPISLGFEAHYKSGLCCFFPLPLDESARNLILRYPIPAMNLEAMQSQFGVTLVLTAVETEQREPEVAKALASLRSRFDNGTYRIYALGSLLDPRASARNVIDPSRA